jgi:hypothetical protein
VSGRRMRYAVLPFITIPQNLVSLEKIIRSSQDIIQKWPAKKNADVITLKKKNHIWTFNGVTSIKSKVGAAIEHGAGAFF